MSSYAIFFDYNNRTYRLPVNPDEIKTKSSLSVEKYEVLGLDQIVVPTRLELKQYSFDCELPKQAYSYVETPNQFKDADYYLNNFERWREKLTPVRFIATNGIGDDINTLVLIQDLNISEKAGEEGDKYLSFSLIEYKTYGKEYQLSQVAASDYKVEEVKSEKIVNPKSNGTHTVVKGDTLWAIAKKYYGNGAQYGKIYSANKDKIKNPSLIYPGQVLTIPS